MRQRDAAGGLVITASHNPYRWNGIKYKASYGSSALPSIVAQIEKELDVAAKPLRTAAASAQRSDSLARSARSLSRHHRKTGRLAAPARRKIPFCLRSHARLRRRPAPRTFHAATASPATKFAARATRVSAACIPNPSSRTSKPLREAVLAGKYDAGFCADGDGDRIGAIDRDGSFVNPHQIFALLVWHLAGTRNLPGDIAKTFSVTKLIDKLAAKFGRKLHEVPIGFKYICELMLEQNILIGGEESGGIGTSLYLPERDATVSALLLAELMAWHGKSLGELARRAARPNSANITTAAWISTCSPRQKEKAIAHFSSAQAALTFLDWPVVRREDMDGIKIYLGDIGWVMVRASGTENLLRVYSRNLQAGNHAAAFSTP